MDGFGSVDEEGEPDEAVADETLRAECFFVDEDAEQELDGGGDVLEDAEGDEGYLAGAGGEEEQGNGRCHPGQGQQDGGLGVDVAESGRAVELEVEQVGQSGEEENARFQ